MTKPLILLSNDDGFLAPGIRAVSAALKQVAEVVLCAPATEQSSTSHALSLNRPLRLVEHGPGVFSVDGTPADCVYVALNAGDRVLPRAPDLVVSGLNHGLNLGNDVFYSGTVAAAREAALRGLPALAVSADPRADRAEACAAVARLALRLIERKEESTVLLNVNFPPGSGWSYRATSLGRRTYNDEVEFRYDPRGGEYLWLGGHGVTHCGAEGTDTQAHDEGAVSLTPLSLQLWNPDHAERVRMLVNALGRD